MMLLSASDGGLFDLVMTVAGSVVEVDAIAERPTAAT